MSWGDSICAECAAGIGNALSLNFQRVNRKGEQTVFASETYNKKWERKDVCLVRLKTKIFLELEIIIVFVGILHGTSLINNNDDNSSDDDVSPD